MTPKIVYSFSYTRELNLHRSKEQLEREWQNIEENTAEFREFVHRLHKDIIKSIAKFGGIKTVESPDAVYVVMRERGLSFNEPMTVVFDDNQKLMLTRYVNLICQRYFELSEAALLLTRAVAAKLPFNLEHELSELEAEQHITMPLHYDLSEKPLKKWLK